MLLINNNKNNNNSNIHTAILPRVIISEVVKVKLRLRLGITLQKDQKIKHTSQSDDETV